MNKEEKQKLVHAWNQINWWIGEMATQSMQDRIMVCGVEETSVDQMWGVLYFLDDLARRIDHIERELKEDE